MSIQPELSERFLILEQRHTGEILRMRRVRGVDGHTVLVLEGSLPPGTSGPPLHVHVDSRETILVKSGLLGVRIGPEKFDVPPGKTAVVPAGVLHTWWNAGDEPLELSGRAVLRVTRIASFRPCSPWSTRVPQGDHRSSISPTCCGDIGARRRSRYRPRPFNG